MTFRLGGFRGIQVYWPALLEVQGRVLKVYRGLGVQRGVIGINALYWGFKGYKRGFRSIQGFRGIQWV